MKLTLISVLTTWLCATGVAVLSHYCISPCCQNRPGIERRAAAAASRISKSGTVPEYKAQNKHSSAVRKTTTAKVTKVTTAVVKKATWVANPIHAPFTQAVKQQKEELADLAGEEEVVLTNGFVLTAKDGKPTLRFPAEYAKVGIGGVAIGDELAGGVFGVCRKRIGNTNQERVEEVRLGCFRRLDEPEFYCTRVWYSVIPATKQVDAIRMHGSLDVGNTSRAYEMVREIADWMKEDYGAVDLKVAVPAGTLALKKLMIGRGMEVEVKVNWNRRQTAEQNDATIDISFTTGELAEENRYERQELGRAVDAARVRTLAATGVNYFTVCPRVSAEAVAKKVVY